MNRAAEYRLLMAGIAAVCAAAATAAVVPAVERVLDTATLVALGLAAGWLAAAAARRELRIRRRLAALSGPPPHPPGPRAPRPEPSRRVDTGGAA